EKLSDFDLFHTDRMVSRMMDMGDVLTLIEQAEKAFDADPATDMANQMMPGAPKNRALLDQVNDKDLDRAEAIVRSMTPGERQNPKIINGSRRLRIAQRPPVAAGGVSP